MMNAVFIVAVLYFSFWQLPFVCVTAQSQQQQANITQTNATLSQARWHLAAASTGDLVFFGGGYSGASGNIGSAQVDIYNVTSGNWTTATLSVARYDLAATSSDDNFVFFGGGWNGSTTFYDQVDIYNSRNDSWSTATLSQARCCLAATSVGSIVLFGGGNNSTNINTLNTVDIYNVTSGIWTNATLSAARANLAATTVSNRYVIFAGGYNQQTGASNVVDVYDSMNGLWNTTTLSVARQYLVATSLGNLAFFGFGDIDNDNTALNIVDIFNSTTQTWTNITLGQNLTHRAATSIGEIVAFGGGTIDGSTMVAVVDMYNVTSGVWFTMNLSQARDWLAATSAMNQIFFGGGQTTGGGISNVVDIFNIPPPQNTTPPTPQMSPQPTPLSLTSTSLSPQLTPQMSPQPTPLSLTSSSLSPQLTPQTLFSPLQSPLSATILPTSLSSLQQIPSLKSSQSPLSIIPSSRGVSLPTGAIVGIVVGSGFVLIGIGLLLFLILFMKRRKQRKKHNQKQVDNKPIEQQGGEAVELESVNPKQIVSILHSEYDVNISIHSNYEQEMQHKTSIHSEEEHGKDNNKSHSDEKYEKESNKSQSDEKQEKENNKSESDEKHEKESNKSESDEKHEKESNKSESETQEDLSSPSRNEQQNLNAPESNYVPLEGAIKIDKNNNNTNGSIRTDKTELFGTTRNKRGYSQIAFNEIVVEKKIGEGCYGKVCLGKWNNAPVALKYCQRKGNIDEFMKEMKLMMRLPPHPNVVCLYGVSIDGPQPIIILEYCAGGSLDKLLFGANEKLSDEHKMRLIRGIAAGMYHLHKFNIVHRDLAARNILLTSGGDPKISDFGLSRILEQNTEGKTKSSVGPVYWMAPESIAQQVYSKKSDVWMFGIVVYEIVAQCEPHQGKDIIDVAMCIRDQGLTPTIPNDCPEKLRQLMQMCWNKQPQQRPSFETICDMLEQ